jgi:hypothetical protein|nr:MAG TPA: upper collar protein [Caudoviricetes sp.]
MKHDLCGLQLGAKEARWFNDATFFDYYTRLKEIAINQFEWLNLPPTCDARFMELVLFEYGYCLFFRHNVNLAYLTLQCTLQGPLNIYRIPIMRRAYSITGFSQECSDQDSVIIWNNYLRQPTATTMYLYAERLTNIQRTIDVNINAQKTPNLLTGSQAQQKTLKALYSQWQGNEPVIFGDKNLTETPIVCLKTDAPQAYPTLMDAKERIWNEAMTYLGIDNANTSKRERLITDEVESNNGQLMMNRYIRLNTRKEACRWINDLFDLNVDVRYRKMEDAKTEEMGVLEDE